MSWVESYKKWTDVLVRHYGSLDGFNDARSFKVMLEQAQREIKELGAFLDAVAGRVPTNDKIVAAINADFLATKAAEQEILQWFENKGIKP